MGRTRYGPKHPTPDLSSNKSLRLWNPYSGTLIKEYNGHGYEVLDADASFDSANLCSGGMDKCVIYWDVAQGKVLRKLRGHAAQVNCVCFSEEGTVIFSGSVDTTVRAWDSRSHSQQPIQILEESKDNVTSLLTTDHEIVTGCLDGRVRRYDLRMGQLSTDCVGNSVTCVSLTRDGQCILASSLDSRLRLLDKDTGEMLNEYSGHVNSKYNIDACISSSDTHIFSGSEDGFIYIWNLIDGKIVTKLRHDTTKAQGVVHSLSHHPTDPCLLTACENKIFLWKSQSATKEATS
ncbi:WD repeat domain-containing protein 83 [Lamellibrachia satsuma]|nr:WD repeat domain-containing protein 83 [Lamellibrachia satsuma]